MADLKITELAALTVVNNEDLIAIVDDPTGTASTKKIRTDDFQSTWHVGARVYNSGNISLTNITLTDLTFDSERYDTDSIHNTSTNTDRLTCNTAGKYLIVGNAYLADGQYNFQLRIELNDATFIGQTLIDTGTYSVIKIVTVSTIYDLAATNYVKLIAYQGSGGAVNINASGNISPEFMMHRIG